MAVETNLQSDAVVASQTVDVAELLEAILMEIRRISKILMFVVGDQSL